MNSRKKKEIIRNVNRINKLIFEPSKKQKYPELLEIVVLRKKTPHFNFLKGRTKIKSAGDWISPSKKRYDSEENVNIQVQFNDTKDERVGKELTKRLKKLNKYLVGEELLYTRTFPIEETSL